MHRPMLALLAALSACAAPPPPAPMSTPVAAAPMSANPDRICFQAVADRAKARMGDMRVSERKPGELTVEIKGACAPWMCRFGADGALKEVVQGES